ncbi:MAG TPA: tripartite tricarboxylate transporter substrate binding protein [Burkholderiaceae bacterium]|nr:tripartite tricarboxylate transporter substrate binding protein [Burkholderiaceae bacterium]
MSNRSKTRAALRALAVAAVAALPLAAAAQTYPTKPVRIMVGANVGGGTDVIARMLAEKFTDSMKHSFVVENRPGASNTIAAEITAKAPVDGHTLLVATNTAQAIAPHLLKLSYDPLKGVQPIGLIVVVPNVLLHGPAITVADVPDLVRQMKTKPNSVRYASSGIGSTQHLAGAAFNLAAGVESVHVPYKGSSQAHVDLIGGSVEIMFDSTSSSMPQIKAGKLKPLAVTTPKRVPELPQVPTMAEVGYPSVEVTTWYGLYTTAGTPKPVIDAMHAELQRVIRLPDVQEKLRGLGGEPSTLTLEQFIEFNRGEYERYGKLIRDAQIKAD